MSLVEKRYNEAIAQMSGKERVERTLSLFDSICEMLVLQISREFTGLNKRELRKKVAQRLYLSDKGALELLNRVQT